MIDFSNYDESDEIEMNLDFEKIGENREFVLFSNKKQEILVLREKGLDNKIFDAKITIDMV